MIKRRGRFRRTPETDLNVTAFMNLMVVLVPFLLITAVFSRMSVLELLLPGTGAAGDTGERPPLHLEVVLRKDRIVVADRERGALISIPHLQQFPDVQQLNTYLQAIKGEYPAVTTASLLAEEQSAYEQIVAVMDAMRETRMNAADGALQRVAMFPDISLGDAPADPLAAEKPL